MRSVVNWSIHFFESLLLQRIEIELVLSVLRYKIEKNAFAFQVQVKIPCLAVNQEINGSVGRTFLLFSYEISTQLEKA